MNSIAQFRLCTLSNEKLLKAVDKAIDQIVITGKIPTRNIPARPDQDYDLLVGELILRFYERDKLIKKIIEKLPTKKEDINIDALKALLQKL